MPEYDSLSWSIRWRHGPLRRTARSVCREVQSQCTVRNISRWPLSYRKIFGESCTMPRIRASSHSIGGHLSFWSVNDGESHEKKAEERDCRADNDAAWVLNIKSGLKPLYAASASDQYEPHDYHLRQQDCHISMKFIFVNGVGSRRFSLFRLSLRFCISRSRLVRACESVPVLLALCVFFMSGTVWVWHLEMPWCPGRFSII